MRIPISRPILEELYRLARKPHSHTAGNLGDVRKKLGLPIVKEYQPHRSDDSAKGPAISLLETRVLTGNYEGHNYPLHTPILPLVCQSYNGFYTSTYMRGVYIKDNGEWVMGNWLPKNRVATQLRSFGDFLNVCPTGVGVLEPLSWEQEDSRGDYPSLAGVLKAINGKVHHKRGALAAP